MLLQHQNRQQPGADPGSTEPIILDSAAETPMPGPAHTRRMNSQHQPHGLTRRQWPQQPQAASSQAGYQARPPPRFGPDYSAPSGFSPGFRATPPAAARGFGSSFRSPSQRVGLRASEGRLAADPGSKNINALMEELSVHQNYDPQAPLPAAPTQQSRAPTADDLELAAVIARYAFRDHPLQGHFRHCLPCCNAWTVTCAVYHMRLAGYDSACRERMQCVNAPQLCICVCIHTYVQLGWRRWSRPSSCLTMFTVHLCIYIQSWQKILFAPNCYAADRKAVPTTLQQCGHNHGG